MEQKTFLCKYGRNIKSIWTRRSLFSTLGTTGFSSVRREVSVLAEGRHVFGRSREGHYKDLTETGNRARKVSGTQGNCLVPPCCFCIAFIAQKIGIIHWNNSFTGNKDALINWLTECLRNYRQNPSPSVTRPNSTCLRRSWWYSLRH